jgi:hypothetical protein
MAESSPLRAPGAFLGDEVTQSSDPPKHAEDLVATSLREGLRWIALQIAGGNERAAPLLRDACARQGAAFGTWAQGLPAADELAAIAAYGSTFHIANVEAPHEDAAWTDDALAQLVAMRLPNGLGVIFTEGAWGRDRAKSKRWLERGFVAIPEAIQSENPMATIGAMLELAQALGWPATRTAPCLYLTRGYAASNYAGEIAATAGRWSLFRYGDVDAEDWAAMRAWPRAAPVAAAEQPAKPTPTPTPPPARPKALPAGAMRAAVVAAVDRWNPSPPRTSRGAVIRRIATAQDAAWTAVAEELAAALDAAGIPQDAGGEAAARATASTTGAKKGATPAPGR